MKLLYSAITLGALAHFSQAVTLQSLITNTEEHHAMESHLVERASDGATSRVGQMFNWATSLARSAQEAGVHRWAAWYGLGLVDATADLVTDAMSDIWDW